MTTFGSGKLLSLDQAREDAAAAKAGVGSLYEPVQRRELVQLADRLINATGVAIGDASANVGQQIYEAISEEQAENMERLEIFAANRVLDHLRKHGVIPADVPSIPELVDDDAPETPADGP